MRRYLFIILASTFMTLSFVWARLSIVSIGYQINNLEKHERALKEQIGSLSYRVNQTKSPRRLELIARQKFQMRPATSSQTILMNEP